MRFLAAILAFLGLVATVHAYQAPGPPNYAAISAATDVAFDGTVQSVTLAKKENDFTRVVLLITKVTKGKLKKGDLITIFHEPGEYGKGRKIFHRWRCPPFAEFFEGTSYSVWAQWDAKRKHYEVPVAAWTKVKS